VEKIRGRRVERKRPLYRHHMEPLELWRRLPGDGSTWRKERAQSPYEIGDISELTEEPPFLWSRNRYVVYSANTLPRRVSNVSKMVACNRKWIWNNVYLSLYTSKQRNSNGYTSVFDVIKVDWTDLNTAVCRGE